LKNEADAGSGHKVSAADGTDDTDSYPSPSGKNKNLCHPRHLRLKNEMMRPSQVNDDAFL